MKQRRRASLVWRLYAVSIVQLILVAAGIVIVGALIGPPHPPHPPSCVDPPHPSDLPRLVFLAPLITFFGIGVLIVGGGAFLTARWIVWPLQKLSRTAEALGAGDLRARVGFTRADEFGDLGRAFDDMADRVQRLLLAEKELLANVSHELRTPLARIRVALDIAAEGGPEAARSSLAEIAVDLSELQAIIEDIFIAIQLELADGIAGARLPLHFNHLRPEWLARQAAERFHARHPQRTLSLDVAEGLPGVHADPVLFRRVLDNLLDNAHKYCPDLARPISLSARLADRSVRFEIEDQGVGISEQDLPRIFSAFFRGERSRSRGTGGVGLGLTLVKEIVDAHAGSVDVKSSAQGTIVGIELPLM
jgi:signal transduction histidine kinase